MAKAGRRTTWCGSGALRCRRSPINDNVLFVSIMPADRPGERAFLNITPFPEYYRIDNRIMTTPQGTGPRKIYINREPGSNQITFWGNMPQDDAGAGESLAIEDPADFTAKLFRELAGAARRDGVRTSAHPAHRVGLDADLHGDHASRRAEAARWRRIPIRAPLVLASHESQPLADDLRVINKVSQNLHAELMLRLLGKEKGTSGSIQGGLEVLRGFLTSAGIKPDQFVFYDGSGLVARKPGESRGGGAAAAIRSTPALGQAL